MQIMSKSSNLFSDKLFSLSEFRHDLRLGVCDGGMLTLHVYTDAVTTGISALKHIQ